MQRALGASEPPGFPMIKFQPSPKKEMVATTQNQETAVPSSQEGITKPPVAQQDLVSVPPAKHIKQEETVATRQGSEISSPLPDKTVAPTISKTKERPLGETPKGHKEIDEKTPPKLETIKPAPPGKDTEKQELKKSETSIAKPAPPAAQEKGKEEPPKPDTSIAKPAPSAGDKKGKEEPLNPDTSIDEPVAPAGHEKEKEEQPKPGTSLAKPALSAGQEDRKQEPSKSGTSIAKSTLSTGQEERKEELPKPSTSISKPATPAGQGKGKQEQPKSETSVAKPASPMGQEITKQLPKLEASVAKPATPSGKEVGKMPPKQPAKNQAAGQPPSQPPKSGSSPAKSAPPPAQPPKQESGGFFGFGSGKTHSADAPTAGTVTGKMFGFGSSFLSSASTLLTSAVQDETKTTPPTPRKMSTVSNKSPKTTPPASPKAVPAKETKQPAALTTEEKRLEKPQQTQTITSTPVKAQPETPKVPTQTNSAPKADLPICPLCKDILNKGSKDPPNFNTCTECKTTVCKQCGFNPTPNVDEVIYSPFSCFFFF